MKVRKIKISTQIFMFILIGTFAGILILSCYMYNRSKGIIISQIREKAENYANLAAASVDASAFFNIDSFECDEYKPVYDSLALFRDNCDLEYIYAIAKDSSGETYYVIDTDTDSGTIYGEEFEDYETVEAAFLGTTTSDSEITYDEWGGHISAFSPIFLNDQVIGIVGVDISSNDVLSSLQLLRVGTVAISAIMIVVITLLLILITKKLTKYFNALNNKVIELADGDLSKQIEFHSGDEMEVIADNINRFIQVVRGLVFQVASSSKDNAGTIGNMNSDVMEISANMEECSATAETVSAYLSDVARQMNELADNVNSTNKFVEIEKAHASESAHLATEHRQDAISNIEEINENIKLALEQANVISKVSDMTEEINSIALQTRILSINAQIEASRAGELGRGFAVVATEISELSSNTTLAVEEIASINITVQHAMNNLREYVEQMKDFMTTNVVGDYEAFEKLGIDYGNTTENILNKMDAVKAQSEEISQMIESVNSSVHDISMAVSDSADQIERFSSATSDISDSMDELLSMKILEESANSK